MIDLNLFLQSSKRRFHSNQIWGKIGTPTFIRKFAAKLANAPLFDRMTFLNGFEYRNSDFEILDGNDPATLCTDLMKFDPVTLEITRCEIVTFGTIRQKLLYLTEYLMMFLTDLNKIFRVGRHMGGND